MFFFSKYRKYRPNDEEFETNAGRARLKYVGTAILSTIRQRRRQWTWKYFAERRDDRLKYVELFQKKVLNSVSATVCTAAFYYRKAESAL